MGEVLVDTSAWIGHFKERDSFLCTLLDAGRVVSHELVIEELMLGGLGSKSEHQHLLCLLQCYSKVSHAEIVNFINAHSRKKQFRVGLVDTYLLCTAMLYDLDLYTHDSGLVRAAQALGLKASK